jgi:hypothetical protein
MAKENLIVFAVKKTPIIFLKTITVFLKIPNY